MERGTVGGSTGSFIQMGAGERGSLNLVRGKIVAYERDGAGLVIRLADGSQITLGDFFAERAANQLYISAGGDIAAVDLQGAGDGPLYASYGPVEHAEKWSALDDLRFLASDTIAEIAPSDDSAGMAMLVPGLLGGIAGPAAALVGGAALLTSVADGGGGDGDGGGYGDGESDGDGDGDGEGPARPTVDDPDRTETVITNTDTPRSHDHPNRRAR